MNVAVSRESIREFSQSIAGLSQGSLVKPSLGLGSSAVAAMLSPLGPLRLFLGLARYVPHLAICERGGALVRFSSEVIQVIQGYHCARLGILRLFGLGHFFGSPQNQ